MNTLSLVTRTQTNEASQSWLGGFWDFLNAPVEQTWMHTLFGGLVAAVIGAGVALLVLMVTVRTQNKGIQKQLELQERSVAEQLSVQRHENTKIREHDAAARFLSAIHGIAGHAHDEQSGKVLDSHAVDRLVIADRSIEELRLNFDGKDDRVLDAFLSLSSAFSYAIRTFLDTKADEMLERRFWRLMGMEGFLMAQMMRYIRSNMEERKSMEPLLVQAKTDLRQLDELAWHKKYDNSRFTTWSDGTPKSVH